MGSNRTLHTAESVEAAFVFAGQIQFVISGTVTKSRLKIDPKPVSKIALAQSAILDYLII
jgi:hypothetical protein